MSKFEITCLVIVGIALGTGAYQLKQDADRSRQIIDDLPKERYEACLETNAMAERLNAHDAMIDCNAESLD